jgi:hypothetical protein
MADSDVSRFQELLKLRRAGVDPNLIRTLGPSGAQTAMQAGTRAQEIGQQVAAGSQQAAQAYGRRPGMYGALGTAGLYGASQLAQQDPLGAFTGTLGSLVGGGVGAGIAKLIPGPAGKVAQFALPVLGGLFGGMGTEQVVTGLAGKAQESGQRPGGGADITVPGTNIPLTETAATRQQREFDRAQNLQDIQQIGGAQLALDKELLGYMMTKEVEQAKAMSPIIERAQRAQLTNAQAMLNSQSAAYQQLGRSAMMGRSTIVGQQERGATIRQALASNPYIGATLQAPSISFG